MFKRKLVWIHFAAAGNDFWWMLFVTWEKDIGSETINVWINKKTNCKYQLQWYYYNPLHWQILYPLDNDTKLFWQNIDPNNYKDLNIEWWFYRWCDGDSDSIFGQIKYKKWTSNIFSLLAWFKYDVNSNSVVWDFADNLQYFFDNDETNILWLIYDSSYWIGFVGWKVNSNFDELVDELNFLPAKDVIVDIWTYTIDNIVWADISSIYWIGLTTNLYANGYVNLGSNTDNDSLVFKSFKLLSEKNKTITLTSNLINISQILNKIRKNSEILCKWNWNNLVDLTHIGIWNEGKTVCIKTDNSVVTIDSDLTLNWKTTNIVIKWKNNKLIIKSSQEWPGYLNIFVDNWAVLFDNSINLLPINWNWDVDDVNPLTEWAVFNWNIFVNGIIAWSTNWLISNFIHRLYLYGSIWSLNTIWSSTERYDYIQKLWLDTDYVDITQNFSWECLQNWKWLDGVDCWNENDKYLWNSLIIKKKKYENPLLR